MPHRHLVRFIFAVPAAFAFVACSDQLPLAPGAAPDGEQYAPALAVAVTGTYTLTVYATTTGRGAVLDTYVTDGSGHPATTGTVTFKYCSLQGIPAPRSACNTGSGKWTFYGSASIIHTVPAGSNEGHALMGYTEAPLWPLLGPPEGIFPGLGLRSRVTSWS